MSHKYVIEHCLYFVQFVKGAFKMAKNSEARINANARYNAKTYKRFAINTRLEYVDAIEQYKIKNNIASDSGIFNAAIMYCIKHNIDLTENDT